jgi:hypothetical protein
MSRHGRHGRHPGSGAMPRPRAAGVPDRPGAPVETRRLDGPAEPGAAQVDHVRGGDDHAADAPGAAAAQPSRAVGPSTGVAPTFTTEPAPWGQPIPDSHGVAAAHGIVASAPAADAAPCATAVGPVEDDGSRPSCTVAQLRRFIKSRPWIPLHELRRRFGIYGDDDDVSPIRVGEHVLFIGLPAAESRLMAELLGAGDVGYELSLDPGAPIVVGVYPMRPVPRG